MNYKIVNGAVSYGAETILEEINFEIKDNEKIAIVGRNGCGKTTLLKALINNEMLEEGIGEEKFKIQKQGIKNIGYLKQIVFEDENITLLDEILKVYKPIIDIENKIKELETKLDDKNIQKYNNLIDMYKMLDGYTYKKEYETVLSKFGFKPYDKDKKISDFSGGQKTKIAFIKLLLIKPDILFLDEPTNNLDIVTIEWLEEYLKNYPKSIVIVSHDRRFLDKIVDEVYEIEYAALTRYKGNYTAFENQKRENYEKNLKDYEYQQKEIKRLKAIADRFRYKPTKAKMALSKLKKIEQMDIIEKPNKYDLKSFNTNFNIKSPSGNLVISVKNLKIGYEKEIAELNFELLKGDKLGIIGANGTGKSTFLRTIVGEIPSISGSFEFGYNVQMKYFEQNINSLNNEKTILEDFYDTFEDLTITNARSALASFMFYEDDVERKINTLSGGERIRLNLCKCLKAQPNLLILDEPTNHMDIIGKESLEFLLKNYLGTLIFVSHDRYFINKIANKLLIFSENGVIFFNGTYDEYMEKNKIQNVENKKISIKNEKISDNKKEYENRKKINKVENQIEKREKRKKEIEKIMQSEEVYTDYIKLQEYQAELNILNNELDNLIEEWENLNK